MSDRELEMADELDQTREYEAVRDDMRTALEQWEGAFDWVDYPDQFDIINGAVRALREVPELKRATRIEVVLGWKDMESARVRVPQSVVVDVTIKDIGSIGRFVVQLPESQPSVG
jgi:hypothetical protein